MLGNSGTRRAEDKSEKTRGYSSKTHGEAMMAFRRFVPVGLDHKSEHVIVGLARHDDNNEDTREYEG